MNIWIVNHYAIPPTEPGGTRHYALGRELVRRGHEVTIFASAFNHATGTPISGTDHRIITSAVYDDVSFFFFPVPSYRGRVTRVWNMVVFALRIWAHLRNTRMQRPDVIIGSSLTLFAALAAHRVATRLRVPFVLEIRDLWPQTLIDMGMNAHHPMVSVFGAIERYLYRSSLQIITLLPNAAGYIASRGGRAEAITWIPNGVDTTSMPVTSMSAAEPFTVMYAGSHGLTDALDSVVDAAAKLDQRLPGRFRFRFIGSGPAKAALQQRVREQAIRNIVFEDPVSKLAVAQTLAQADAFILALKDTKLYRYGISPNKLHEYMAAGRPTILAGQCPNNPIQHAHAGVTVAPDDSDAIALALEELASMPIAQRAAMGSRGRKYVEEFHDFAILAAKVETVLRSAVEAAASTRESESAARDCDCSVCGVGRG